MAEKEQSEKWERKEALERDAAVAVPEMVLNLAAFFHGQAALLIRPIKGGGVEVRFKKD